MITHMFSNGRYAVARCGSSNAADGDAPASEAITDVTCSACLDRATCSHADNWYGAGLCFACWRLVLQQRRTARRAELARLLSAGCTLTESNGGRINIDWRLDGDTAMVGHHPETRPAPIMMRPAFCVAYTAERLAEHLESREFGFGWTLQPWCITCGEQPATVFDGDPICVGCVERHAEALIANDVMRAEDRAEGY